jgi:putative transcriptional regulator
MTLDGHLLVASPHMEDPNFARTVVLIVQHSDEGAFGLVLNRPSNHSLADVWKQVADDASCDVEQPLYIGGPVEGPLLALHTREGISEREIVPGVFFSTQREALESLISGHQGPFLIVTGYSGWGSGQLEGELKAGAWLTIPARREYVFPETEGENLWRTVARDIGRGVLFSAGDVKNLPDDPSLN